MFFNYPIAATADNWIHYSIYYAFVQICNALNDGTPLPVWPEMLPNNHKSKLERKRKISELLIIFKDEAAKIDSRQRTEFIAIFVQQNQIADLLNNTVAIPTIPTYLESLVDAAANVCEEGFELLSKTGTRDKHYQIIWDSLKNKTCPFCGCEPFDAPTLPREHYDHYLLRSVYKLTSTNLLNLVPMGSKCNEHYKKTNDILCVNNIRRKALNPYGDIAADISLVKSTLFSTSNGQPNWQIEFTPDTEEIKTWDEVFSLRTRLIKSVLTPYFYIWLNEIYDYLKDENITKHSTDEVLIGKLNRLYQLRMKDKNIGLTFLKPKVFEALLHHRAKFIRMIRLNLPS